MTILWSNNASTTVSGSITPTGTTVALAAGTGVEFPSPTGGDYYVATFYDQATKTINEIVHVTAMSGDVATIVRAQEGTVAGSWNAGDIFANLVTAGTLRAFVQAGTGPANTSLVFVGTDVSTTPGLVICNTTPVPSALAIGMLFNIKIANNNPGPVNLQLNGLASIPATRANGAAMLSGDLTASEEMTFVYNGVNFNTMLPDIQKHPSQTVFYVRTDGNDNNTGFANTPTDAFATVYGAINQIKARYTSQVTITIRVADGSYVGGFGDSGGYIAGWNIIGNVSNPGNVVIDATSLSPPAGAQNGIGCLASGSAQMEVSGFTFKSYEENMAADQGGIDCHDNHFTGPISGQAVIAAFSSGVVSVHGTCQYDPAGHNCSTLAWGGAGLVNFGYHDPYVSKPLNFIIVDSPVFSYGTVTAVENGLIGLDGVVAGFTGGTPTANKYYAALGGGITTAGYLSYFPGTYAGYVASPGWAA